MIVTPAVKSVQLNLGDFSYAAWRCSLSILKH